ncbi:hypothetical protein PR048_001373 [Dryococelus australis]|uniref:DDE Tnp4 domain-containing protein n=1 Tax=Dryococelus australis TaxID=614101 RepID=A0ABQ9IHV2_9NEOP|nr:hypothetical protein PR048_001373 [Dryococelus australis]
MEECSEIVSYIAELRLTLSSYPPPPSKPLPQMGKDIPYVFVADKAFPLTETIMKPYAGVHPKGSSERIFNFRLSRALQVVKNIFGIISSVVRVLRKPLLLAPENAQLVVMAVACLHNYLKIIQRQLHSSRRFGHTRERAIA